MAARAPKTNPAPAAAPMSTGHPLVAHLVSLRIARDRLNASKREKRRRVDLAIDWMREKPSRTLGEANAYVGLKSINDEVSSNRAAVREAVDSLLALGFDIEVHKANSVDPDVRSASEWLNAEGVR